MSGVGIVGRRFAYGVLVIAVAIGCSSSTDSSDGPTGQQESVASPPGPVCRPGVPVDVSLVGARAAHTASTLPDGRILVAGGCVVDGCSTATDETFLVAADGRSASRGPRMSVARDGHTAVVLADGRVVLVGGFPGEGAGVLASIDIVDPDAATVEPQTPLGQARGGHAAVPLRDGRVLIIGGWVGPDTYTSSVEMFDPANGTIRPVAALPYAADALDAVVLSDGRVLVTGGRVAPGQVTDAAAIFDPATETWSPTGSMGVPREKHFSTLLPDGRVLVMGGTSDDRTMLPTTELFDPATGTFEPGPDMAEPRYKLPGGAVTLADGRVVIAAGGHDVEVLDPERGTTQVVARSPTQRWFATLNRLGDGALLLLGGYDDHIRLVGDFVIIPASSVT